MSKKVVKLKRKNNSINSQIDKMKILVVCSALDNGGVEKLFYTIYNNIDKSSFDLSFVTFDKKIGDIERKIGARVFHVPPIRDGVFKYYQILNELMKNNKFDAIHSNIGIYSFICLFVAWKNKIKIRICHSHNFQKKMTLLFRIKKGVFKFLNNTFATHFVACGTDAAIWQFGKQNVNNNKVLILNNAVEIEKFKFDLCKRNEIREKLQIQDKFVIGHVGRFTFEKNHKFIISLAQRLKKIRKDFIFLLVGDGPELDIIKSEIKHNDLNDYIILLGARADVNELLNAFDLFILPSLFEAFPVTLIEAQVNGLSCLVSDNVTLEAKENKDFEFVPVEDEEKLDIWIKYICEVIDNRYYNRGIYNKDLNKYSIETIIKELEHFYKKILIGGKNGK